MSEHPQIRGVALRGIIAATQRLLGRETIDKAATQLSPEMGRQLVGNTYVSGSWYSIDEFKLVHRAILYAAGRGAELMRELAREATIDDFRGIYRVLTFVLTPEAVMKRTPKIWGRYYDVGEVSVESRDKFARASWVRAHGFDRNMWQGVIGGSAGLMEVCGAKDLRVTIESGGGDEDCLTVAAEWR